MVNTLTVFLLGKYGFYDAVVKVGKRLVDFYVKNYNASTRVRRYVFLLIN